VPRKKAKPRRARGTGSVSFHKPSGLWVAQMPRQIDGSHPTTYHASEDGARAHLDEQVERQQRGLSLNDTNQPFGRYLVGWYEQQVGLRPQTRPSYEQAIRATAAVAELLHSIRTGEPPFNRVFR
jgi:hypothetical protein